MRKIGIVKWELHNSGGGERVAVNLANELSEKYEVHVISVISPQENFFQLSKAVCYTNLSPKKISMSKNFIKAVRLLRSYIIKNNIEVLLGIGISMNSVGVASTIGLNTKFISCDHTNSIIDMDTIVKRIQRYVAAKFSDKIITLTTTDRDNYIRKYKINSNNIDFIYNWITPVDNLEKYEYNIDSKKLITVGRFASQKGYDYLSKVAVSVLLKNSDWQWDIFGSGDDKIKEELIKELREAGVLSQVNFKGNVKGIENIYPNHGIYVMSSRYEGLPLVLLEAKQYGLPIVSFDCPTGPSDIVLDGINGYLIDNYSVNSMSDKINELIDQTNLRLDFSKNSMKDTEKFSKEKILQQWINLIEEIAGGKNAN